MKEQNHPNVIKIRNAHVHNLKHIDVDIPLNKIVGIAGCPVRKSSPALGVLYAEGSRRYLDALSTYTRRRMTQAPRAQVDEVLHIPAALALHQRPGVPGNPEYVWNRIGTVEHITTDIFKTCKSLLSQWPLSGTHT